MALTPGEMCAQDGGGSEDCLWLNAFTPRSQSSSASSSLAPILFFIHGGAFLSGDAMGGASRIYDGAALVASQSICVFSVQYRLGSFGFLATSAGQGALEGNFGLQDQRAGMLWVQNNAAAFSCDPGRVTIVGQSAGAQSVVSHLASPPSWGLFTRAIAESDLGGMMFRDYTNATVIGDALVKQSGCGNHSHGAAALACLRQLTQAQVNTATALAEQDARVLLRDLHDVWGHLMTVIYFWSPISSTQDLPLPVQTAFSTGRVAKVPWIVGSTQDEGDFFVPATPWFRSLTPVSYKLTLEAIFPDANTRKAVLGHYPPEEDSSVVFSRLLTEYWFRCGDLALARHNAKLGVDTWTYIFRHPLSPAEAAASQMPPICGNTSTCHAGELLYVFGNCLSGLPFSPAEAEISKSFYLFWGHFVRGEDLALTAEGWPPTADKSLALGDGERKMEPVPEICSFWDNIGY